MMSDALLSNADGIRGLLAGVPPDDFAERERLLTLLCGIYAGALTPRSEDDKRGVQRVLAILKRKRAEGGCGGGDTRFWKGRWSAFQECIWMLEASLPPPPVQETEGG